MTIAINTSSCDVQCCHAAILALRPRCGGGGISSRGGQELGGGPTAQHVCRGMSTHKYTYTRIADIERVRASE